MIILNDNLDTKVRNQILKFLPIKSLTMLHGTFASRKSTYVSDVDLEIFLYYEKVSDKMREEYMYTIIEIIKKADRNEDIYFTDSIIGFDHRFDVFNITVNDDLTFSEDEYDYKKFVKIVNQYHKTNIITSDEHTLLLSVLSEKPTRMDVVRLNLLMEDDFRYIHWNKEEILEKHKMYRNRKVLLKECIVEEYFPNIMNFIFKFNNSTYIPIDMSIILFDGRGVKTKNNGTILLNTGNVRYGIIQQSLLTEIDRYDNLHRFFFAIFKNYQQQKWFKCLKRLRTIITRLFFGECDYKLYKHYIDLIKKDRNFIFKMRKEISDLTNTELGVLNQLKNQFSVIIDLIDLLDMNQIVKLIHLKLNDVERCAKCFPCYDSSITDLKSYVKNKKKNKLDKKILKDLLKKVVKKLTDCMNQMAYQKFFYYYNKLEKYLPFKLDFEKDFIRL